MKTFRFLVVVTFLCFVVIAPSSVFAYSFDIHEESVGAWVKSKTKVVHPNPLIPLIKYTDSDTDKRDYWDLGEYTWGSTLSTSPEDASGTGPYDGTASAWASLSTGGDTLLDMRMNSEVTANVSGIGSGYFGVEAYNEIDTWGQFSIVADPGESTNVNAQFNFLLNGSQGATGDFASYAGMFFGVYDSSFTGDWEGYDDDLLLGYYQYGDEPYGDKDYNANRVIEGETILDDSLASLTVQLEADTTYAFYMWMFDDVYGSENLWDDWEANDGFDQDGKVDGSAYSSFGDTFHLTGVDVTTVPEPATVLLLGVGLVGLAAFKRKFFRTN